MKIHGGEDTPLIQCVNPLKNIWIVLWNECVEDSSLSFVAEEFDHKPTISEIKNTILNWHNAQIDQQIASGFVWKGIPVWLSMENQFNYKVAHDIAIQSDGLILPTFKFGTTEEPVYYAFEDLGDLKDFYTKAMAFVTETLAAGWAVKDSIDWGAYEKLLES